MPSNVIQRSHLIRYPFLFLYHSSLHTLVFCGKFPFLRDEVLCDGKTSPYELCGMKGAGEGEEVTERNA